MLAIEQRLKSGVFVEGALAALIKMGGRGPKREEKNRCSDSGR